MSGWVWVVLAILILANALYVAAEFGAVGARRSRVRRMSDDGHPLARRLLPFVEDAAKLDRYVSTSQIGITSSSLMVGAYAQATVTVALAPVLAAAFQLSDQTAFTASAIVVLALLTAAQLVLGELVPKALALQFPTQTALATVVPMQWSLAVLRPVITALNGTAALLLRLIGVSDAGHRHLHSPEELDLLIAESRDGGLLGPKEQERLRRALHLGLHTARDLMAPLEKLTMLEASAPWEEVVRTVAASPYSRLPVYRGTREQVVGMLRVKDLVDRYAIEGQLSLPRLMRPVIRIADTLPANQLLTELRGKRLHSAIVVAASGRVVGLITIQDVLGELLGWRQGEAAPPEAERRKVMT